MSKTCRYVLYTMIYCTHWVVLAVKGVWIIIVGGES